MKSKNIPPEYGFLTRWIAGLFRFLQKYSLSQVFIDNRVDSFRKSDFSILSDVERRQITIERVRKVDQYIGACLLLEMICVLLIGLGLGRFLLIKWSILLIVALRLIDIIQVNINLSLFDVLRTGREVNYMASVVRSIINVIINYFEIILCFGIIYNFDQKYLGETRHWTDAFYFSAVTQITIGFGQLMPHGILKLFTVWQFILGYFFTALIIGRFISLLPPGRTVAGDSHADDDANK